MELKRKDDRIGEAEVKSKRLEEQLKDQMEALKSQEEANKRLKDQLRAAKTQKQIAKTTDPKQTSVGNAAPKEDKKEKEKEKEVEKEVDTSKDRDDRLLAQSIKTEPSEREPTVAKKEQKKEIPKEELKVITLIGQREKLSRDDLTQMMLAGEESLRMLIRKPSEKLIDFIKSNLDDEDAILIAIPRFDMPKSDFES